MDNISQNSNVFLLQKCCWIISLPAPMHQNYNVNRLCTRLFLCTLYLFFKIYYLSLKTVMHFKLRCHTYIFCCTSWKPDRKCLRCVIPIFFSNFETTFFSIYVYDNFFHNNSTSFIYKFIIVAFIVIFNWKNELFIVIRF